MRGRVLTLLGIVLCILQVYAFRNGIPTDLRELTSNVSSLSGCNVLHASWIGDGWCDNDDYNTPECNYDMGDCCQSTCNPVIHADCGVAGYQCKNPSAKENRPPSTIGGGNKNGGDSNDDDNTNGGNSNGSGGGSNGGNGNGSGSGSNGGNGSGSEVVAMVATETEAEVVVMVATEAEVVVMVAAMVPDHKVLVQ